MLKIGDGTRYLEGITIHMLQSPEGKPYGRLVIRYENQPNYWKDTFVLTSSNEDEMVAEVEAYIREAFHDDAVGIRYRKLWRGNDQGEAEEVELRKAYAL